MIRKYDRKLVLPDGTEYYGYGFGGKPAGAAAAGCRILELVFNTSMAGYQEILSDPSYTGQAVVMSYPLIGNYGMPEEDYESGAITPGALIVREYNPRPSNFRGKRSLGEVLARYGVPGLEGIDTRSLVRRLRTDGSMMAAVAPAELPARDILPALRAARPRTDTVPSVSPRQAPMQPGTNAILPGAAPASVLAPASVSARAAAPASVYARAAAVPASTSAPAAAPRFRIAVIDCGVKENILREMRRRGADLTLLPWNVTAQEVLALQPDGIFISNGPGDPADVPETEETLRQLIGKLPVFGICLGHQLIARAMGASTWKLHFGHRGGNHPVKNLLTGKVEITSQNHSFTVDESTLPGTGLTVTHRNLLDGTVEGLHCPEKKVFSVQYHPESAPGPQDSSYLFDEFFRLILNYSRP